MGRRKGTDATQPVEAVPDDDALRRQARRLELRLVGRVAMAEDTDAGRELAAARRDVKRITDPAELLERWTVAVRAAMPADWAERSIAASKSDNHVSRRLT